MRDNTQMLGRETKRQGSGKFFDGLHLPIEPGFSIGTERVCPAQSSSQMSHAQPAKPFHRIIKAMVFEMKPLANSKTRRKMRERQLWSSVLLKQTHVIVTVIGAAFRFFVPCGGHPGCRQVVEAIPMNAIHDWSQQLGRALNSENLHFFCSEGRHSGF